MNSIRFPLRRLLGVLFAGTLPIPPLFGQVPVIPRAEPIVKAAAITNASEPEKTTTEAPATEAPVATAETSPAPESAPDPAAILAKLVRENNPFALVVEPAGNGSEVFVPFSGAKSSGLIAARWENGVLHPYTREEFRALEVKWKDFQAKGLEAAEQHLALMEPIIDRDVRGTVELVRFVSESPFTATSLFTTAFREKLQDVLGLPFYAAAPSRSVVIAFAKGDAPPSSIGSLATGLFNDSIYPASLEIFEVGKDGVRVVGTFKED